MTHEVIFQVRTKLNVDVEAISADSAQQKAASLLRLLLDSYSHDLGQDFKWNMKVLQVNPINALELDPEQGEDEIPSARHR